MLEKGPVALKRFYFEKFGILVEKEELKKIEAIVMAEAEQKIKAAMERQDLNFFITTLTKVYENPNKLSWGASKEFRMLIRTETISEDFIESLKDTILEKLGKKERSQYKLNKKQQETWQLWNLMQFFVKRSKNPLRREFIESASFKRITNNWNELKKNITAEKVKQTKWIPIDTKIVYREGNELINLIKSEVKRNREVVDLCRSELSYEQLGETLQTLGLRKEKSYTTQELTYEEYWRERSLRGIIQTERGIITTKKEISKEVVLALKNVKPEVYEALKLESDEFNNNLINALKVDLETYLLSKRRF